MLRSQDKSLRNIPSLRHPTLLSAPKTDQHPILLMGHLLCVQLPKPQTLQVGTSTSISRRPTHLQFPKVHLPTLILVIQIMRPHRIAAQFRHQRHAHQVAKRVKEVECKWYWTRQEAGLTLLTKALHCLPKGLTVRQDPEREAAVCSASWVVRRGETAVPSRKSQEFWAKREPDGY